MSRVTQVPKLEQQLPRTQLPARSGQSVPPPSPGPTCAWRHGSHADRTQLPARHRPLCLSPAVPFLRRQKHNSASSSETVRVRLLQALGSSTHSEQGGSDRSYDGAGCEHGDGPGGAAGEHGDAGVRVADAVVPARRRVGAQDPHEGGHARQGRRHHRRILRNRRGTYVSSCRVLSHGRFNNSFGSTSRA